jgi:hypothetical protein
MTLGIGANVAMFTIVRSVLLKPLPFADSDRLMKVWERDRGAAGGRGSSAQKLRAAALF